MDPQTTMETAAEGAKAMTKLIEILEKMFGPHWRKRQADADEYADNKKLEVIRENPDMKIAYVGDRMYARERTEEELLRRADRRKLLQTIRQERNIEEVIAISKGELLQAEAVSDEEVEEDWIVRFFDIVKDISSEDMQLVWGKILAGEIKRPGSFSLRTLEVVRNLSATEAQLFNSILPYVIRIDDAYFIPAEEKFLKDYKVTYGGLLKLDDCGLILTNPTMRTKPTIPPQGELQGFYTHNRIMRIKNELTREKTISFGVFLLTAAGVELANLLQVPTDDDYYDRWAKLFYDRNLFSRSGLQISVHAMKEKGDGNKKYSEQPLYHLNGKNKKES